MGASDLIKHCEYTLQGGAVHIWRMSDGNPVSRKGQRMPDQRRTRNPRFFEIFSLDEVRAYVLGVAISGWRPVQRLIRLNGGVE